ncbi:ABC transporter permease [Pontibacter pudoricolor]|uniref:ABC transporter permease n=1 Tax=Pontibacter pudoricolor TaxID=2694930 RepID=UPI001391050F|nr:ABC transporter permease [Pontibacter pudoricolor]
MGTQVSEEEKWDLVIEPKHNWFDLNLKEIWKYRDLLWLWVRREYVGAYKQTILGPFWHFISPIFGTLTYMLVFGKIANLSTDGVPMFLFYNAGLAIWNFFNGCYGSTSSAFQRYAGIFGKVYFPRLIMPMASIISSLIKFGIQFSFFLVVYAYIIVVQGYEPSLGWGLLYIPVSLFLMAGIGFGFGIIVSAITTKYRDLNLLMGFVMTLLMYATPIIYSFTSVDHELKKYLAVNPLVAPTEAFKFALFGVGDFSILSLTYSFSWMIGLLLIGIVLFNKTEKNFMDTV